MSSIIATPRPRVAHTARHGRRLHKLPIHMLRRLSIDDFLGVSEPFGLLLSTYSLRDESIYVFIHKTGGPFCDLRRIHILLGRWGGF